MIDVGLVKKSICRQFDLEEICQNESLVHTDKYFDDGDELHIVLKEDNEGKFLLTDEGHTLMWLSYEDFKLTPIRKSILDGIVSQNRVNLDEGRITASATSTEEVGEALSAMVQALIQVADMRRLSHNNVVSTFLEDIKEAYKNSSLSDRCEFRKKIEVTKGDFIEPDIFINGSTPVLVYGVNNSERAKETFINLLFVRDSGSNYRTVVIIGDDADISKKERDRLINAANRPIMGTEEMISITERFVET